MGRRGWDSGKHRSPDIPPIPPYQILQATQNYFAPSCQTIMINKISQKNGCPDPSPWWLPQYVEAPLLRAHTQIFLFLFGGVYWKSMLKEYIFLLLLVLALLIVTDINSDYSIPLWYVLCYSGPPVPVHVVSLKTSDCKCGLMTADCTAWRRGLDLLSLDKDQGCVLVRPTSQLFL